MSFVGYSSEGSPQNTVINAIPAVQAGDTLVIVRLCYPGGLVGNVTQPSGFSTPVTFQPDFTGSNVTGYVDRVDVMTKTATASEPASYTVASEFSGGNTCYLFAFRGRDTASIALAFTDYVADLTGINASASFDVSGYTAAAGDDVLVMGFASTETQTMLSSVGGFTPPSGYTEAFEDIGWRIGHTAAYRENLTAGETGALTFGLAIPTAESVAPYGLRIILPAAPVTVEMSVVSAGSTMQRGANYQVTIQDSPITPTTSNTSLVSGNDSLACTLVEDLGNAQYRLTFAVGDLSKQVNATGYNWSVRVENV